MAGDPCTDADLSVHVWIMRDESTLGPVDHRPSDDRADHGDATGECRAFFDAGVDGVLCDVTATAVAARAAWLADR